MVLEEVEYLINLNVLKENCKMTRGGVENQTLDQQPWSAKYVGQNKTSNTNSGTIEDVAILKSSSSSGYSKIKSKNFSSNLSCFYSNPTSLRNKIPELKCRIQTNCPDVMLFTETWFNDQNTEQIENYKLYNRNRILTSHGGVGIYIKNGIKSFENGEAEFINESIEQVWVTVFVGSEKILIGCIYRPPRSTNNLPIFDSIRKARELLDHKIVNGIMICGDFNLPDIFWDEDFIPFTNSKNFDSPELGMIELLKDVFLVQNVNFPTFVYRDKICKNILDYVITESFDRIKCINSSSPLGDTKHGHVVLEWNYQTLSARNNTFL